MFLFSSSLHVSLEPSFWEARIFLIQQLPERNQLLSSSNLCIFRLIFSRNGAKAVSVDRSSRKVAIWLFRCLLALSLSDIAKFGQSRMYPLKIKRPFVCLFHQFPNLLVWEGKEADKLKWLGPTVAAIYLHLSHLWLSFCKSINGEMHHPFTTFHDLAYAAGNIFTLLDFFDLVSLLLNHAVLKISYASNFPFWWWPIHRFNCPVDIRQFRHKILLNDQIHPQELCTCSFKDHS